MNNKGKTWRGYAIRCHASTKHGFVTQTLNKDSQWTLATDNGSFATLEQARKFFEASTHDLRGSSIWIEGPFGGRHGLFKR
jgi:hypothetical protein